MKHAIAAILMITVLASMLCAQDAPVSSHFESVHVVINSNEQPLAAYQLDFTSGHRDVKIVGIEGGEHRAFSKPPYYDPIAMQGERAVLAAYSTKEAKQLPKGLTRIATIHLMIRGDIQPAYKVKLTVSATTNGSKIPATIRLERNKP